MVTSVCQLEEKDNHGKPGDEHDTGELLKRVSYEKIEDPGGHIAQRTPGHVSARQDVRLLSV